MMKVSGRNKRRDHTKKETMKCRKEIRLTYGELEELQKQAAAMGVTESQYLRILNHIGVNINQITHNHNSRLYSEEDKHRLYVLMKNLKDLTQQLITKL